MARARGILAMIVSISVLLISGTQSGLARGGGGHAGGGGGAHFGGGHPSGGGAAHFGGGHFGGGAAHFRGAAGKHFQGARRIGHAKREDSGDQ